MIRTLVSFAFLTALVTSATGCSTVDLAGHKRAPFASTDHPAVRCVCLWQEAAGQTETGETVRGFAGQIYFFTANDQSSVGVEGDVHVFLFDDHGSPDEQARPISEAGFANVEWQAMRRDSQLGPTYSLFVPYPRAGNLEANCALRLRLTQPDGSTLFSEMTQVKLPGLARREQKREVPSVDPRREQQWSAEQQPAREGRTTGETIGMRRGDRFIATANPGTPSRGTEIGRPVLPEEKANPNIDSRVKYYEEKLQTILKQRAANQSSQNQPAQYGPGAIEQTGYRQSSGNGQSQQVENPFYSF
jgi:hypothetical protein